MQVVVLLAVGFVTCTCAPDSTGTSFIFGYVRDANWNITNQLLSVTVLNGNSMDCTFTIKYRDGYDEEINPLLTKTFKVLKTSMIEVPLPSWYGWQYDSGGMQVGTGPRQLISAQCTCPVTLVANNYDNVTFQGDSYLVLPITWGKSGSIYAFTLPPASNDLSNPGNHHVSIIPTHQDVKGTLTVFGSDPLTFTAKLDGATTYFMKKTPRGQAYSYHIQADGPILILAGVTCAGSYKACDHAAFMPHPLPASKCYQSPSLDESHPAYINNTNGFYVNIPDECKTTQQLKVSGNGGAISKDFLLSPLRQTPLLSFDSSFGGAVNMHSENSAIHVTRYHDFAANGKQGAFIDTVPSVSQFINGNSTFYTRNDNDTVEVVCVFAVCTGSTIDGTHMSSLDKNYTNIGLISGENYYALSVVIPNKGFHQIQSTVKGTYTYYVVGQSDNALYGYMGAINMPQIVLLPKTTSLPTGTTKRTSTTKSLYSPTQTKTSLSSTHVFTTTPSTTKSSTKLPFTSTSFSRTSTIATTATRSRTTRRSLTTTEEKPRPTPTLGSKTTQPISSPLAMSSSTMRKITSPRLSTIPSRNSKTSRTTSKTKRTSSASSASTSAQITTTFFTLTTSNSRVSTYAATFFIASLRLLL